MLLVALVTLGAFTVSALAQTPGGAFSKLSPGQQKIARALFEGQPASTAANAPRPLTLDEIAAMKKPGHEGWGEVFKGMKKQGLVTQKNLGEVVSGYEHRHPETARLDKKVDRAEKPEKMDRSEKPEKMEKPEKSGRR
jgi:hypothetical protein